MVYYNMYDYMSNSKYEISVYLSQKQLHIYKCILVLLIHYATHYMRLIMTVFHSSEGLIQFTWKRTIVAGRPHSCRIIHL